MPEGLVRDGTSSSCLCRKMPPACRKGRMLMKREQGGRREMKTYRKVSVPVLSSRDVHVGKVLGRFGEGCVPILSDRPGVAESFQQLERAYDH